MLNRTYNIASHAHRWIVSRLKLLRCRLRLCVMYQCLLARDMDADEAIGVSCFKRGLLSVEYVEDFYILMSKCELDEVFGIGLDEMFGDGVIFGHVGCPGSDG